MSGTVPTPWLQSVQSYRAWGRGVGGIMGQHRGQAEPSRTQSLREKQLLQTKSPLLNSSVCTHVHPGLCIHVHMCMHAHRCTFRPGAPPHRAGGGVTSASHYNCRSSGAGRRPGKDFPSGPRGQGSTWECNQRTEGMPKFVGVLHLCPSRAHLLKVGIPLLGRDDKLDPFAHVVLELTDGREGGGGGL